MENIKTTEELKNAIELMEFEQLYKWQIVREQLLVVHEGLKPLNLIKSTISAVGLASGYVSRKIVIGRSANVLRKLIGSALQFGVTNVVARHADSIKTFGQTIFQHFSHKKEMNAKIHDN